jgi:hypothetical protein
MSSHWVEPSAEILSPNVVDEDRYREYRAHREYREYDRLKNYNELSIIGRELLDKIYGDVDNMLRSEEHPLEKYIISFDEHIDSPATIIIIANRMGFDVQDDPREHLPTVVSTGYSPAEQFIDYIVEHIDKVENKTSTRSPQRYSTQHKPIPSTKDMIDMTEPEFEQLLREHGIKKTPELYGNRLTLLPQLHLT